MISFGRIDEGKRKAKLCDAAQAMTWFERIIEEYGVDCGYHKTGRLTALWAKEHYAAWEKRLPELNELTAADARMISREALAEEIGSSLYFGAALIGRAGHVQPAKLMAGYLAMALQHGARVHGMTAVESIERRTGGFHVRTSRGDVYAEQVVLATNGHPSPAIGALRRGIVPIGAHMIATEELSPDLARSLIPNNRAVSETRRVVNHYRLSSDGRRLVFGGRARFIPTSPDHAARIIRAAMIRRFPQLAEVRISHSWSGNVAMTLDHMPHMGSVDGLHYAMGCNGSGVTMMGWLGHCLGRKILSGERGPVNAYDDGVLPSVPFYNGKPWFLFALGSWYQFRDWLDHYRSAK